MKNKDKKAKKRVDDEIKLKTKISKLLRDFESLDTPMYNMDFCWKFDYLAH